MITMMDEGHICWLLLIKTFFLILFVEATQQLQTEQYYHQQDSLNESIYATPLKSTFLKPSRLEGKQRKLGFDGPKCKYQKISR